MSRVKNCRLPWLFCSKLIFLLAVYLLYLGEEIRTVVVGLCAIRVAVYIEDDVLYVEFQNDFIVYEELFHMAAMHVN